MSSTATHAGTDQRLLEQLFDQPGYSTDFSVSPQELAILRDAIHQQWLARISEVYPQYAARFDRAGMQNYHLLAHLVEHEALWPKQYRVLPNGVARDVAQFASIRRLMTAFGAGCRISDTVFVSGMVRGHTEVYWRLVRPNVATDVGSLHTDKWFHAALENGESLFGNNTVTVKMWLAIHAEPGRNGLYVVPHSHRKAWKVRYSAGADGHARPALDEDLGEHAAQLAPLAPGQAILFNENLLHGGAINAGSSSRVSVEITFILEQAPRADIA